MTAYINHGKTSSAKRNIGWKPKLSEKDHHALKRTVSKNHKSTAAMVTAELNIHLEDPVSTKTIWRDLHRFNIHCRAAFAKPRITENNVKRQKRWCDDHRTWRSNDWKYILWSNVLSFTLFPKSGRVYAWRIPKDAYNPECLVPTVKHGSRSVII
jgi:hypothetical protein